MEDNLYEGFDNRGDDEQLYDMQQSAPKQEQGNQQYYRENGMNEDAAPSYNGAGDDTGDKVRRLEARVRELEAWTRQLTQREQQWHSGCCDIARACGQAVPVDGDPDIPALLDQIYSMRTGSQAHQEELGVSRRREASSQLELSRRTLENVELRRELSMQLQAGEPNVQLLKQLLLDQSVSGQFARLKSELEAARSSSKHLQQELDAVTFTPDSKVGHQLMERCRKLQAENEELGRDKAEGRTHALQQQLQLARDVADELRRSYAELYNHCVVLNEENEEVQVVMQLARLAGAAAAKGGVGQGLGGGGGLGGQPHFGAQDRRMGRGGRFDGRGGYGGHGAGGGVGVGGKRTLAGRDGGHFMQQQQQQQQQQQHFGKPRTR